MAYKISNQKNNFNLSRTNIFIFLLSISAIAILLLIWPVAKWECHYNFCQANIFPQPSILRFVTICILIFVCTQSQRIPIKKIFTAGIYILSILAILNLGLLMHSMFYTQLPELFKDIEQRKKKIFGWIYPFAQEAQKKWPGYHRVELQSDLDFSQPLPMTIHRQLSYFMYPIDLRVHAGEKPIEGFLFIEKHVIPENLRPEDVVVFYDKKLFLIKK